MPSSASRENFLSATTEELEKLTGAEAGTSGAASSSAVAAHPGRSPLALPTALFYGATSIGIIACNKITLTTYAFPSSSALALAQFAVTCACLGALALAGAVELAPPTADSFRVVVPLTALFVADVLMGLFATGSLSLPMFTVLRRFSIPCTMLLERFVGQANPSPLVQASVWGMVGGAVVAAYDDLAFDAKGYAAVLLNDLFTALRGVYVKAALPSVTRTPRSSEKKDVEAQDPAAPRPPPKLSKLSLLFYNALLGGAVALCPPRGVHVHRRRRVPASSPVGGCRCRCSAARTAARTADAAAAAADAHAAVGHGLPVQIAVDGEQLVPAGRERRGDPARIGRVDERDADLTHAAVGAVGPAGERRRGAGKRGRRRERGAGRARRRRRHRRRGGGAGPHGGGHERAVPWGGGCGRRRAHLDARRPLALDGPCAASAGGGGALSQPLLLLGVLRGVALQHRVDLGDSLVGGA